MKLINNIVPFIETYIADEPKLMWNDMRIVITSGLHVLKSIPALSNADIWYCMFTTARCFQMYSIQELAGEDTLNKVRDKQALLILENSFEPFLDCIDSIYENIIIKYDIPSSQVIFLNNMYDAPTYNVKLAKKLNKDPIQIYWFSSLEFMLKSSTCRFPMPEMLAHKNYDKKFLNLNRRWRTHRQLLSVLLYSKNLLNKGHVSLGPCEPGDSWDYIWTNIRSITARTPELLDLVNKSEGIKTIDPLYLDTNELNINRAEPTWDMNTYYADSYFSVISETTYFKSDELRNSRFITEKTFKAIGMKHPFILVTIPGSLEVLKHLGYKTFAPFIDESYDLEEDDNKRMLLLVKEIERLCNLSEPELYEYLNEVNKICEYNYNVLINKQFFIYENYNA
jgi:hypothetical protein